MEDEYDIYGDLESFEKEAAQDNEVVRELNAQIAELRSQIAEKEHEKQDTIARNTILLENISSLLVTAKAELKRKDAVIADFRRERDNTAFRRKRPVQRHDQATQTTLIRLLSREVQTEGTDEVLPQHRFKREKEEEWHWERKRVEEDHRRERERFKGNVRIPVRDRLGGRGLARQQIKETREGRRRGGRERAHEEERERERQARRGPRSPDDDRSRAAVRFRSPVRVKADESSVPDSASDIELSRAFIPMNRKELDRYVKEIGREQNRSPVVVEVTKQDKTSKPLDEVSGADLWNTRVRKKSKTPKKQRKLAVKTPIKKTKSPSIIQSDEIGTTACGSSVLSPVKSEDIEQRMSILHGHPPLPDPPKLVIPPPEPPIIEHVPELPPDDDVKLNDSRELKIIESSDEQNVQGEEPVGEDEPNSSAETIIERTRVENDLDLEDGEIITPAPSPAPPSKTEIAEAKRNAKIAKAVAQLAQETKAKLEQKETSSLNKAKEKTTKLKRKRSDRSPKVEPKSTKVASPKTEPNLVEIPPPPPKEPTPEEEDRSKPKHNLNGGAFQLRNAPKTTTQRRNSFSGHVIEDKEKRKQRLSEPSSAPKLAKKKTAALHELFGSDDDNSFVVAPREEEEEEGTSAKRRRTESVGEMVESKKSRQVEDVTNELVEEIKSAGTDGEKKDEDMAVESVVPENENQLDNKEEQDVKNDSNSGADIEEVPEQVEEVLQNDSTTSEQSKDVPGSESTTSFNGTVQSDESEPAVNGNDVPETEVEPVVNSEQDDKPGDSQVGESASTQEIANDEGVKLISTPECTPSHPHEVIVVSNKYCEYRIEDDNEAETTFYVTRKKKKKSKSKSRNASLNASGAN